MNNRGSSFLAAGIRCYVCETNDCINAGNYGLSKNCPNSNTCKVISLGMYFSNTSWGSKMFLII